MVRCGDQRSRRVGLRIATGDGCTNRIGDGRGFLTMTGAGRRITTGAGCIWMADGDGGRVRRMGIRFIVRSGRQRMSRSADLVEVSESELASGGDRLGGCRWDRETSSIRGGDVGVVDSGTGVSADSTGDLLRCGRDRDSRM